MKKIVIFASGSGSNAEKIMLHFKNNPLVTVAGVFSNKSDAKVLDRAKSFNVPNFVFNKQELNSEVVLNQLNDIQPDLIVLAGFLLKFPLAIIQEYPDRIINIHPALLPKYGGKGMYGMHVHQAVLENKDKETGISIHYVNEHYDEGAIIAQYSVRVESCGSAEDIAQKVHELEHKYFPVVIENILICN